MGGRGLIIVFISFRTLAVILVSDFFFLIFFIHKLSKMEPTFPCGTMQREAANCRRSGDTVVSVGIRLDVMIVLDACQRPSSLSTGDTVCHIFAHSFMDSALCVSACLSLALSLSLSVSFSRCFCLSVSHCLSVSVSLSLSLSLSLSAGR